MTPRMLSYIIDYKRAHNGNSPSYREIGNACSISSTSEVKRILSLLEKARLIKVSWKSRRSIEVVGGRWTYGSA